MSHHQLSQALVDSFTALADEVQSLTDSKTVLEHKLRFAHEQFQYLADKYAPAAPEIAETLTKLQLPPHTSVDPLASVPLPQKEIGASQHQIALVIRDGRRAASRLASLGDASKTTASSRDTLSRTSDQEDSSSMSTALEQDFTVQGKRGNLQCPFSKKASAERTGESAVDGSHNAITASEDFPCATLEADTTANDGFGKCPIRYMDKHSPEEIARYVELHKHELPRSHEVCLRRYQGNEDQIRKLDSKYGNMTSMIEDLSQLHKPMLPERDDRHESVDGASNQRVEDWAQGISVSSDAADPDELAPDGTDDDRQSHFDRPLKEVRVGESPSRPWGISVPIYDADTHGDEKLFSPPPAPPVRMPSPPRPMPAHGKAAGKCPFDHTKFAGGAGGPPPMPRPKASNQPPAGLREAPTLTPKNGHGHEATAATQPVFIGADAAQLATGGRHMVFQGPVFIGYPMEDAMRFMNQFQGN